jgi:hypothetical protein
MFCWSEASCKERIQTHPYWMSSEQWADSSACPSCVGALHLAHSASFAPELNARLRCRACYCALTPAYVPARAVEQGGIFATDGSSGWSSANRIFVRASIMDIAALLVR